MSEDLKNQDIPHSSDTVPLCEFGGGENAESNERRPSHDDSEDADRAIPADYAISNESGIDDEKCDRCDGRTPPDEAHKVNDRQDAQSIHPAEDTIKTVVEQTPNPKPSEQQNKVIPDEVKRIALDLHAKGKSPKQIAAHYSVSDYGLTEGVVLDVIEEQKGTVYVSDNSKLFLSSVYWF